MLKHFEKQIRLFVEQKLGAGEIVCLSASHYHYITRVMRLKKGAAIQLFNGKDGQWQAVIDDNKGELVLKCNSLIYSQVAKQKPFIRLYFPLLKRDRMGWLIEKACELGIDRLSPVVFDRTNSKVFKIERAKSIAIEACEQSERLDIPIIDQPFILSDIIKEWKGCFDLFVARERMIGLQNLPELLRCINNEQETNEYQDCNVGILVGPEGGFTDAETMYLKVQKRIRLFSLGNKILRSETAAIASLAILDQFFKNSKYIQEKP